MARFYTSFTKPKEAEKALSLIADLGYMVLQAGRVDHDVVGNRGEWLLCVDTERVLVSCTERLVYKGAEWINDAQEVFKRSIKAAYLLRVRFSKGI